MKIEIAILLLVLSMISCKKKMIHEEPISNDTLSIKKDSIKLPNASNGYIYKPIDTATECYYSVNDDENILIDFKKDTLITDKGEFSIHQVLDDEKSYIYHIYNHKNEQIAIILEDMDTDDKLEFYIKNSYVKSEKDWYHLYRTDGGNLVNLGLSKEKTDFLKKYKVIK